MVAIAVIILIFVGPKQLPEVARTIARFLNEFKRTTSEFSESFYSIRTEVAKTLDQSREKIEEQVGFKDLQEEVQGLSEEVSSLEEKEPKPSPEPTPKLSEKDEPGESST